MTNFNRVSLLLFVTVAILPVSLFAFLGWQSRMIHDDFGVAAVGLEQGAWDGFVHFYNSWTSAYSSILLRLSLAEYVVVIPPLLTLVIVAIGLLGLYWLLSQIFTSVRLVGSRRQFALGAAGLALAAAINAFYTPESFYWYSASVQYTLPLVCLILGLALAAWTVDNCSQSLRRLMCGAGGCAWISFLTAGASEMFLVFQVTFLTLLAALAFTFSKGHRRRALLIVGGAILIATAIGLLVQLSSPGIWNRMDADAANYRPPIRSLSQLAVVTAQLTFESIGRQEVIAGFTLLFGLGITLGLRTKLTAAPALQALSAKRVSRAALAGLALQTVFLPILLEHHSDSPRFFGRYSASYMVVLAVNAALLLVVSLAFWQRRRLSALLEGRKHGHAIGALALLLAFLILVALTQVRSIDARASTYLFASALDVLLVLALLYRPENLDDGTGALERASLGTLCIAWVTIAALICVTFIGHGFTSNRMMAGPALLQVVAGLFCGLYLGIMIKPLTSDLVRLLAAGGLIVALVVGSGIFLGQARLVPDFQNYAREWDARHKSILAQRESGLAHIEVAPLSFDLADYIGMGTLSSAERFYGVQSIEIVDA